MHVDGQVMKLIPRIVTYASIAAAQNSTAARLPESVFVSRIALAKCANASLTTGCHSFSSVMDASAIGIGHGGALNDTFSGIAETNP